MSISTQLVVVGAGPGGYAAAFYAADLGLKVALVDPESEPRRRLRLSRLHPVEGAAARRRVIDRVAARRGAGASTFGEPKIDLDKLRAFKNKVVEQLTERHRAAREAAQGRSTSRAWPTFRDAHTLDVELTAGGEGAR